MGNNQELHELHMNYALFCAWWAKEFLKDAEIRKIKLKSWKNSSLQTNPLKTCLKFIHVFV